MFFVQYYLYSNQIVSLFNCEKLQNIAFIVCKLLKFVYRLFLKYLILIASYECIYTEEKGFN